MKITIGTIVGTGDRAPRLKIECPNGDLMVHGLDLQSVRDAAFVQNERYGVPYLDAVRDIKIALLETTYAVSEDTAAWAGEK